MSPWCGCSIRICRFALPLPLASAICLRASCVAPVRGGTYFSLPPQRKVGKRKRAKTASTRLLPTGSRRPRTSHGNSLIVLCCRRPQCAHPPLQTLLHWLTSSLCSRPFAANGVQVVAPFGPGHGRKPFSSVSSVVRRPTHSLPHGDGGFSISWAVTSVHEMGGCWISAIAAEISWHVVV